MATWRDGPEYAPRQRPTGFVEPAAEPLEAHAEAPHPAAGAPADRPVFSPPETPAPILAELAPAIAPQRNPHAPFAVVASTLTGGSAWSAVHTARPEAAPVPTGPTAPAPVPWTPEQPFAAPGAPVTASIPPPPTLQPGAQINPPAFPAPGTPGWFGPPPPWARVPDAGPVTVAQMIRETTPGVLIPLLVGAVFAGLSVIMLATSFALSARIAYRRQAVRLAYGGAAGVLSLVAATSLLDETVGPYLMWDSVSAWAQFLCWVLPVVLVLIVGAALRAGDRPDRIG